MYIALKMSTFKNLYLNCFDREVLGSLIMRSSKAKDADIIISTTGIKLTTSKVEELRNRYISAILYPFFSVTDNYVSNMFSMQLINAEDTHAVYHIRKENIVITNDKFKKESIIWHFTNRIPVNKAEPNGVKRKIPGGRIDQMEFQFKV